MGKTPGGRVDRARLNATTDEEIFRQIAEDPDTAPEFTNMESGARNGYFRTSDEADVLGSLEHCLLCLERVNKWPQEWKWAVLAMHNAVQGAMVCFLSGTANLGALEKKSVNKFYSIHYSDNPDYSAWDDRLASFNYLLDRVFDPSKRVGDSPTSVFHDQEGQKEYAVKLNGLRDELWHFRPSSWSIEIAYMLDVIWKNLELVCQIAGDGWACRNIDPDREKIRALAEKLRTRIKSMEMSQKQ